MTKWLEHQEGCFRFASYLSWTLPGYMVELTSVGEAKNDADDDNEESEVPDDDGEQANCLGYSVAKKPAHPSVPIATLIDHYGAVDFIPHLTQFLKSSPHTSHSAKAPVTTSTLPVYKCVTVRLPAAPQVIRSITKDVICARPATPAQGLTPAVPYQFDTVLARESDPEDSNIGHPLDGEYIHFPLHTQDIVSPVQGLTVGQVRVIFSLPGEYGSFTEPLAYVEWFTRFGNPVADLGMYQVSRSSRHHRRRASIIPVSQIERCVHLIPKFGRVMDRTWTTDNVLELCKTFYVNCYFRHLDFLLFRYLLA